MTELEIYNELHGEEEIKNSFMELLSFCPRCNTLKNKKLLISAYNFAYDAHLGMKRKTGEPFIAHPLEVCKIVVKEIKLGVTSAVCALLHDVVEDNEDISLEMIAEKFGEKVASIIDGLTKITNVYDDEQNVQAATFRKMLMSIPKDIRVILIKLADRLHNMRTLDGMSENRQIVKAGETLYVYAPLARRLGLNKIGRELEDLSFKFHLPENYNKLMQMIENTREKRDKILDEFKTKMATVLEKEKISYEIIGVRKSLYATWTKMNDKQLSFDEIHNFQTIRLIFKPKGRITERRQCYNIYSLVTDVFMPRKGSLQDLVKNPKANGFEALIVDIMISDGNWREVQILSNRMAEIAERGYSSEKQVGRYKEPSERDKWIESIGDQLLNPKKSDLDFLDNFKLNLYISEIYVFTPAGKIVKLPRGATVLDFAFQIHTELGFHCIGAKVNKKLVNIGYVLNSADQVEVLDSKSAKPEINWLDIVVSARAKDSLRAYFKKEQKDNVHEGEKRLKEIQASIDMETDEVTINKLVAYFQCKDKLAFYDRVGRNLITRSELIKGFKSVSSPGLFEGILPSFLRQKNSENIIIPKPYFSHKSPFIAEEFVDLPEYSLADCCHPIPGDKSIAYKDESENIIIHQISCKNAIRLNAEHGKSVAKVSWKQHKLNQYLATLFLKGMDRKKTVHDLTYVISDQMNVNIKSINISGNNGIYEGTIVVYVSNLDVLNALIVKLKRIDGIMEVRRIVF
ncbi:MAG: RelA/SpoT family protein [Bacteroidales bacterium]